MPMEVPDMKDGWRIFRIMSEFVDGFEAMSQVRKAVSIFGSARAKPNDTYYKAAEETGRKLVKVGYTVITGGGPGIMEAANKGAYEAQGTSIGLNISLPQEQEANRYQTLSLNFHYFYARKVMFVKYASAFICFPGGFGTLDETFETLTLVQTLKIRACPVILYGSKYWTGMLSWIKEQLSPRYIDPEDIDIFRLVDDVDEAVKLVRQSAKRRWWHPHDEDLRKMTANGNGKTKSNGEAGKSGEGTRYGTAPARSSHRHAIVGRKPEQ